jgi:hypothetical protein
MLFFYFEWEVFYLVCKPEEPPFERNDMLEMDPRERSRNIAKYPPPGASYLPTG